jgi:hypothetical protein
MNKSGSVKNRYLNFLCERKGKYSFDLFIKKKKIVRYCPDFYDEVKTPFFIF